MWHTLFTPQLRTEPKELRLLKERLAHVNCKCNICQRNQSLRRPSDLFYENVKYTKDGETQSEGYILADSKAFVADNFIENALCPTCCMTLNLLRGGVVRVLKDEESETLPSMFRIDKFTNKGIMSQERNTALKSIDGRSHDSGLTFRGLLTDTSSEATLRNTNRNRHTVRKRCSEKVTFQDPCSECLAKPRAAHDCVCLQEFVDSIRPPLNLSSWYLPTLNLLGYVNVKEEVYQWIGRYLLL